MNYQKRVKIVTNYRVFIFVGFNQTLTRKKKILSGISAYFNPNELIAIMGPSGKSREIVKITELFYY